MRRKTRKNLGVSLAELMIAIAVIAIGLSGVAASLYFGFSKSNTGDDLATATQYSRMVIEIINSRSIVQSAPQAGNGLPRNDSGVNDTDADPPRALDAPPLESSDFLALPLEGEHNVGGEEGRLSRDLARYQRKVRIERMSTNPSTPEYKMGRMRVTIYWEAKGVKKHAATTTVIPLN